MKKLLLLISSLGLFFSLGYGQSAFDYYVYEDGGSTHTLPPFNYDAPPSWFNEIYIKGAAFSPYDSNFTVGYLVYEIFGGGMDLIIIRLQMVNMH